jgi:alkanesulfonate monooxygenase SsuD/methylene tetrahydromethanopterin reductase-like flavin-dependent oxidoreductase (luciferase family)
VRVFQRFATLDAASNGRAEIVLGRGSFTESFPLFGYPLDQYEVLFDEKLTLFVELLKEDATSWRGTVRAPLVAQQVYPKTARPPMRTWIGVGGSPESVVRAAHHGLPLMLAIIGGNPRRFAPYVQLYHSALAELGKAALPVGVHSPGHIADTDDAAREAMWPTFQAMHARIGRERGWPPMTRAQFDQEVEHGSLYVGAPETVAQKIAATIRALGVQRFDLKYSAGRLSHHRLMRAIDLYGSVVIPRVRALLSA